MNTIDISGRNIIIRNGSVVVDGKDVSVQMKELTIVVQGNVERLEVDACNEVQIQGNSGETKTMSGDVRVVGKIEGDVSTQSGDVKCAEVSGHVKTMSGDVDVQGRVMGNVHTMSGDITHA